MSLETCLHLFGLILLCSVVVNIGIDSAWGLCVCVYFEVKTSLTDFFPLFSVVETARAVNTLIHYHPLS